MQDFITGVALLQEAARMVPDLAGIHEGYRASLAPTAELMERLRQPFHVPGRVIAPIRRPRHRDCQSEKPVVS